MEGNEESMRGTSSIEPEWRMQPAFFAHTEGSTTVARDLREGLRARLGPIERNGAAPLRFWIKALFWLIVAVGAYGFMLQNAVPGWGRILAAAVYGWSSLTLAFNVGHDASHGAASRVPWLDHFLQRMVFVPIGIDAVLWRLRHLRSHHVFTNVDGADMDASRNSLIRLASYMPLRSWHRLQYLYAPLVYAIVLNHSVFYRDWRFLFGGEFAWMRQGVNRFQLVTGFVSQKVLYFLLNAVLPAWVLGWGMGAALGLFFLISSVQSLVFVALLIGTHFFEETATYSPNENRQLDHAWAEHQFRTSCDWNADSLVAGFFSGGANTHLAHHLFPSICHVHHRSLTPLIQEVAAKHDLPLFQKSLCGMLVSHFRYLRRLGMDPIELDGSIQISEGSSSGAANELRIRIE
ncbi:MAG: acyl-CoA desaturase [Verrucomicrobiales bacterium]|nr:acyl-CoA desaturase [Verrucomicrobiales bacterium]